MGIKSSLYRLTAGLFFFVLLNQIKLQGQVTYNYYYRVIFKDKGSYTVNDFTPAQLLSQKAIARRQKYGITVPESSDLPVYKNYIDQVKAAGFTLHCTSRWMNSALFKTESLKDLSILTALNFVYEAKLVKKPLTKSNFNNKLDFEINGTNTPPYNAPLTMISGDWLHQGGFSGTGLTIAVLDGGFILADQVSSLEALRASGRIKGTRDIIKNENYVYNYHNHGTAVLTVLAGSLPFQIAGTAPSASYWLIRTEDVSSEFPVEEDFWAAGAEYADSVGADIISSSLGYYNFDDPAMNYSFSDMDGKTTFVTRAAQEAAKKGILVVNSAGNERNKPWVRIIAPSDGNSVLTAGAVDEYLNISTFSSAGPSADGTVKPDNCALGVSVPVQVSLSGVGRANGTSFSCPVLSGISACLMQAFPEASPAEIIQSIHKSGDRYLTPDSLYGYGIPDMKKAYEELSLLSVPVPESDFIAGPNPFNTTFDVIFREVPNSLMIEIFSSSGKLISKTVYDNYISRRLTVGELEGREQGMYIVRLTAGGKTYTRKVIKLKN